jgi:hypothetical protein
MVHILQRTDRIHYTMEPYTSTRHNRTTLEILSTIAKLYIVKSYINHF